MNTDEKYEYLSAEFSRLDTEVHKSEGRDAREDSAVAVMKLKDTYRILYFVMDVLAVTCNGGLETWIDNHAEDVGWICEASDSYSAIGHHEVSLAIKESYQCYLNEDLAVDGLNYSRFSKALWDREIEVVDSLYLYLMNA